MHAGLSFWGDRKGSLSWEEEVEPRSPITRGLLLRSFEMRVVATREEVRGGLSTVLADVLDRVWDPATQERSHNKREARDPGAAQYQLCGPSLPSPLALLPGARARCTCTRDSVSPMRKASSSRMKMSG